MRVRDDRSVSHPHGYRVEWEPAHQTASASKKSSAVGKLSDGFAGKIVYLDDPGYAAARAVSNSMIDRRRR